MAMRFRRAHQTNTHLPRKAGVHGCSWNQLVRLKLSSRKTRFYEGCALRLNFQERISLPGPTCSVRIGLCELVEKSPFAAKE